jgi:MFS transporter, DHA1 family, tetracycline resistance protein
MPTSPTQPQPKPARADSASAGVAFGLGIMSGPALGGLLSGFGLSIPRLIVASLAFGNTIFGFFFMPESLPPERRESKPFLQMFSWKNQFAGIFRQQNIQKFLVALFPAQPCLRGLADQFSALFQCALWLDSRAEQLFLSLCWLVRRFHSGILFGKLQARFGERALIPAGLTFMVIGLAGMAFVPNAWMLFPAVAVVALGTGISIPSLTALVSLRVPDNEQGRLMGGMQTLLALTNIFGPTLAGISFEVIAISAPYWLGSLFFAFCFDAKWRLILSLIVN